MSICAYIFLLFLLYTVVSGAILVVLNFISNSLQIYLPSWHSPFSHLLFRLFLSRPLLAWPGKAFFMLRRAEAQSGHTQQRQPLSSESPRVTVLQNELLETSVGEQLGPLAKFIVRTLNRCGPLTLKALADIVKQEPFNNPLKGGSSGCSVLNVAKEIGSPIPLPVTSSADVVTDAAIKEIITRLLLHRVVQHDASSGTYSVLLGYGLFLRTLFPLVVQYFQKCYGETGVTLLMVFYQLAVVPWEAALRLAIERRPALSEALRHCAREMERLGLIEFLPVMDVSKMAEFASTTRSDAAPTPEESATVASTTCPQDPCRLNVSNILFEMLHESIRRQLLAERYADGSGSNVACAIVEAFTSATRCRRVNEHTNNFPLARPRTSTSMPLRTLLREVTHPELVVTETLSRMCRPEGDNLVSSDGTSGVDTMEGPYRFRYDAAVEAMQRDCCERMVFARHGVLGVRIIKLLLQHHYMEDKMLAEEAISTLPRTREVLHAMMRDGYVRQQEVPKSSVLADRLPRNSTFLWGCSIQGDLLPAVRLQVVMALQLTLARLTIERQNGVVRATAMPTPMSIVGTAAIGGNGEASCVSRPVEGQRTVAALESSATALMEMMLVLEFY
uniref:DNA-directed RNA polymerase III subunit RPC3 n=1 Tax=Trypanosoma congolense (strain IL3000) TaxID=1068625 RepID=G0UJB4_TRYCI|nr:conserved hypothetical protein [Trypanosoma congolense IL3000]